MKSFIVRIAIFLLPILIVATIYEIAMYRTGDSWPVAWVVHEEKSIEDSLYGRKFFSHNFFYYKERKLHVLKPDIAILGSSRVMQIRREMFRPLAHQVYNFGGMVRNLFEFKAYCELIDNKRVHVPKVVVFGIDPWWFNKNGSNENRHSGFRLFNWIPNYSENLRVGLEFFRQNKAFPLDAIKKGATSDSPYFNRKAIGIMAIESGSGFRADGSRQYSPEILLQYIENPKYIDREKPPVIERVKSGNFITRIDEGRVNLLIESLDILKRNNVEVHLLYPPFSSDVLSFLQESSKTQTAWEEYFYQVPERLKTAGYDILLAVSPATVGMENTCMYDGMHPGEVFMGRVVANLIEKAPKGSYLKNVNLDSLKELCYSNRLIPLAYELPISLKIEGVQQNLKMVTVHSKSGKD